MRVCLLLFGRELILGIMLGVSLALGGLRGLVGLEGLMGLTLFSCDYLGERSYKSFCLVVFEVERFWGLISLERRALEDLRSLM